MLHQYSKSLHSYNPIPGGCVLYLPLWALRGPKFKSIDTWGRACTVVEALRTNEGYDFDGTDDVIQAGAWGWTGDVGTFAFWAKGHDTPPTTGQQLIDFRGGMAVLALQWSGGAAGKIAVFSGASADDWGVSTPTDVAYHHVVFVLSGTSADLYLDNAKQGVTQTITAFDIRNTTGVGIGALSSGGNAFDGEIGEVAIYNRALSAGEIDLMYNKTKGRYL